LLKDQIGIFHACLAQAFLALLVIIALATSPIWRRLSRFGGAVPRRPLAILALVISGLIYGQLALGATMRHQHRDLAIWISRWLTGRSFRPLILQRSP
jgi:cytochrome c oxidase assembly protein subunit 15